MPKTTKKTKPKTTKKKPVKKSVALVVSKKKKVTRKKPLTLDQKKVALAKDFHDEILENEFGGDKNLYLFFVAYLKHNRNATRAYKFLNPKCTLRSCSVLGARQLAKVNISLILDSMGLGVEVYLQKLLDGLNASQVEIVSTKVTGKGKKQKIVHEEFKRPDHAIQKEYHSKLGKLLGLESEKGEPVSVAVQVNNLIEDKKKTYGI